MIPYSTEVFVAVLAEYNEVIWPLQILAFLLGAFVLIAIWRPIRHGALIVNCTLSIVWAWTGAVYHLKHFVEIDFWAYVFGTALLAQAALLIWSGLVRRSLIVDGTAGANRPVGTAVVLLGLVLYPLLSLLLGREGFETGYFGTAPAPTVLFTLGVLFCAAPRAPLHLFAIPLAWCALAGYVAFERDIWEDYTLVLVGALALGLTGRGLLKTD